MSNLMLHGLGGGGGIAAIGDAVGSGTAGSILFVDGSGNLAQDNAGLYYDDAGNQLRLSAASATDMLLRIRAAAAHSANLTEWQDSSGNILACVSAGGAFWLNKDSSPFGMSSAYVSAVMGDKTGATAANGGVLAFGRNNKSHEPYMGVGAWDNGTSRAIYYGGTGWGLPDATSHNFYTSATYTETNDSGVLRFNIDSSGVATFDGNVIIDGLVDANVQLRVQGGASQSANLTTWEDSGGSVLSAIDELGAWHPPSMNDATANNNSVYYSTDASKLVYKDSGSTVNNLY